MSFRMMMRLACLMCTLLGSRAAAHAQAHGRETAPAREPLVSSVSGAIQLASGISLMRYTDTSLSPNETLQPTAAGMPPGPGLVTTCCISGTPFLLEGGLGLSDRMLVGGLLQFHAATESVSTTTPRARELMWSLAPKVDYQLFPSLRFNPFIGITASVAHLTRNYNEIEDTRLSYGFYARAGTRYFVLEELSIDSALAIGGYFGSGSQTSDRAPGLEQDYDVSGFDVSLALAISVWLR